MVSLMLTGDRRCGSSLFDNDPFHNQFLQIRPEPVLARVARRQIAPELRLARLPAQVPDGDEAVFGRAAGLPGADRRAGIGGQSRSSFISIRQFRANGKSAVSSCCCCRKVTGQSNSRVAVITSAVTM